MKKGAKDGMYEVDKIIDKRTTISGKCITTSG